MSKSPYTQKLKVPPPAPKPKPPEYSPPSLNSKSSEQPSVFAKYGKIGGVLKQFQDGTTPIQGVPRPTRPRPRKAKPKAPPIADDGPDEAAQPLDPNTVKTTKVIDLKAFTGESPQDISSLDLGEESPREEPALPNSVSPMRTSSRSSSKASVRAKGSSWNDFKVPQSPTPSAVRRVEKIPQQFEQNPIARQPSVPEEHGPVGTSDVTHLKSMARQNSVKGVNVFGTRHKIATGPAAPPPRGSCPRPSTGARRKHLRSRISGEMHMNWATSSITPSGPKPTKRMGHSQTTAGFVLFLFGGGTTDGKFFNDLLLFDSATWSWVEKACVGAVPSPRAYHTATAIDFSGDEEDRTVHKVLIFGGWDGMHMFNDMYLVEDCGSLVGAKQAFFKQIKARNAPSVRSMHTMTSVFCNVDGDDMYRQSLILFGGWAKHKFLNDMHVYDVVGETWTKVLYEGGMRVPEPRGSHSTVAMGGQLLVFGGQGEEGPANDLWRYDVESRTWRELNQSGDVPSARSGHGCVMLEERYMLIFGGHNGKRHLSDMFLLDTQSLKWKEIVLKLGQPTARSGHQLSVVGGTRVYMTFGWSVHGVMGDIHALDTRQAFVQKISAGGGPVSSKMCQVNVKFVNDEKVNQEDALSFQWHRSKNGKPFLPIEGATSAVYLPNADDINASLGVSCFSCVKKVPIGPSFFAQIPRIDVDPDLGSLVKSLVDQEKAKFNVNLLGGDGTATKMKMIFTSSFFELRTLSESAFKEDYQTSFRIMLSSKNPYAFVLQVHQDLSLPFAVQNLMERDLLALTARAFWATALRKALSG